MKGHGFRPVLNKGPKAAYTTPETIHAILSGVKTNELMSDMIMSLALLGVTDGQRKALEARVIQWRNKFLRLVVQTDFTKLEELGKTHQAQLREEQMVREEAEREESRKRARERKARDEAGA